MRINALGLAGIDEFIRVKQLAFCKSDSGKGLKNAADSLDFRLFILVGALFQLECKFHPVTR